MLIVSGILGLHRNKELHVYRVAFDQTVVKQRHKVCNVRIITVDSYNKVQIDSIIIRDTLEVTGFVINTNGDQSIEAIG